MKVTIVHICIYNGAETDPPTSFKKLYDKKNPIVQYTGHFNKDERKLYDLISQLVDMFNENPTSLRSVELCSK